MTGPGNDIIALKSIDISRTHKASFYSKILSPAEQRLYASQFHALPFERFVWLLWSVKEAVYKCLQRQQPELVFGPTRIVASQMTGPENSFTPIFNKQLECAGFTDAECFCSQIVVNDTRLHARSVIYGNEWIHSVAQTHADFSRIRWGVKHIEQSDPASQSALVRAFLLERLKTDGHYQQISIEKDAEGRPWALINGRAIPISLSHHEQYVAYAMD